MSDEALRQIAKDVSSIVRALGAGAAAFASALGGAPALSASGGGPAAGQVASASQLDGEWGDPEIKKDPPRWQGESFVARRFSETSAEYLDEMASFNDWRAQKDDESGAKDSKGRPRSGWARKDASLARGWAKRIREGWRPKTNGGIGGRPATDEDYDDVAADDGIPF